MSNMDQAPHSQRESPPRGAALNLQDPRKEIERLITSGKTQPGRKLFGWINLKNVNPSQLVDADIRMWQRIKEAPDRIALEEFRAYEQDVRLSRSESRNAFRAFLAERLTPPMMARGLNKDKKN